MRFLLSWLKEFIELSVPPETLAERLTLGGLEVTRLEKMDGDWLFEAEVTPNRPDLLSHLGIARETAAILGRSFRFPRWLSREFRLPEGDPGPAFPVTLEDSQGCQRYIGVVIERVRVSPSSPEMARRLEKMGLRPVNNIVDVTNLCMLEMGQPMHAFDLESLEGSQIRVRRAKPGETLVTIDGMKCLLSPEQLVIADAKKPVALAGVMGGQATQITERTKRVLLESAWFQPSLIRRSARIAKLSSDSSYRFERGVDPEMVPLAALRAARWIARLSGGAVRRTISDTGESPVSRPRIPLKPRKAQEILGVKISSGQQRRFLEHVGCKVQGSGRGWSVGPPSWRPDLKIAEDLYEELARLSGVDRCPPTLPPLPRRPLQSAVAEDPRFEQEMQVRRLLVAAGMEEIMTYSLLHPDDHGKAKTLVGRGIVELKNPLSLEQAVLRNTLLVGALQAVSRNLNRKTDESFRFFEIGSVFGTTLEGSSGNPTETRMLGLLVGGIPAPAWGQPRQALGIFHLKGILQLLCERLGIESEQEIGSEILLKQSGKTIGWAGSVNPGVAAAYEIPEQVPLAYAELEMDSLPARSEAQRKVELLAKIPPAQRDLAIVVSEQVRHAQLWAAIREAGRPLLKEVALFDLYQGKQVPAGKKSLAFRLRFSDGDRTLTEAEIQSTHQKILDQLQKEFGAVLR